MCHIEASFSVLGREIPVWCCFCVAGKAFLVCRNVTLLSTGPLCIMPFLRPGDGRRKSASLSRCLVQAPLCYRGNTVLMKNYVFNFLWAWWCPLCANPPKMSCCSGEGAVGTSKGNESVQLLRLAFRLTGARRQSWRGNYGSMLWFAQPHAVFCLAGDRTGHGLELGVLFCSSEAGQQD